MVQAFGAYYEVKATGVALKKIGEGMPSPRLPLTGTGW